MVPSYRPPCNDHLIPHLRSKTSEALTAIQGHAETLEDFSRDLSVNGMQCSPDSGKNNFHSPPYVRVRDAGVDLEVES